MILGLGVLVSDIYKIFRWLYQDASLHWWDAIGGGIVGIMFVAIGLYGFRKDLLSERVGKTKTQFKSHLRWLLVVITMMTLIWNRLTLVWIISAIRTIRAVGFERKFILPLAGTVVFQCAGFFLICVTVKFWIFVRYYGPMTFTLTYAPVVIGGELVGRIVAKPGVKFEVNPDLVLECVRSRDGGGGAHDQTFYQDSHEVTPEELNVTPDGLVIPVRFQIPSDCVPTDWCTHWALRFGDTREITFYTIPIFSSDEIDESEMQEIRANKPLNASLRRGLRDAKLKRGKFVE